jgi:hypothetical protein
MAYYDIYALKMIYFLYKLMNCAFQDDSNCEQILKYLKTKRTKESATSVENFIMKREGKGKRFQNFYCLKTVQFKRIKLI